MNSRVEHDAGTILFNLTVFPPKNEEEERYQISLLKRRFYEWERKLVSLGLVSEWKGTNQEHLDPKEWTQTIFEVFWNEVIRGYPSLNASSLPQPQISNIKRLLINSITNP